MKTKIKQFFCSHSETQTESWLEKNCIKTETTCVKCGKFVPAPFSSGMNYSYQITLLERARNLKAGERIRL